MSCGCPVIWLVLSFRCAELEAELVPSGKNAKQRKWRFARPALAMNSILVCVEVEPPTPVLYQDLPSLSEHCHWNEVARSAPMAKNAVDPAAAVQSSGCELMA